MLFNGFLNAISLRSCDCFSHYSQFCIAALDGKRRKHVFPFKILVIRVTCNKYQVQFCPRYFSFEETVIEPVVHGTSANNAKLG